jgi:branched-chain amino acid transport system substrate-binding protein
LCYLVAALGLVLHVSCHDAFANERIKVGAILPLSGPLASFGQSLLEGIRAANLDRIELVVEDDECVAAKSVKAFKSLTEVHKSSFILGPVCGSPQHSIAPLLKNTQVVSMLLGSGAENLFTISDKRVFSPQYSNDAEATYNANFMSKLGISRAALIFYEDIFCWTHEKAFRKSFKGDIAAVLTYNTLDPVHIKPLVTKLRQLKVDGIYAPDVSPFLLGLRKEMSNAGLSKIPVISIFSAQTKDLLNAEGSHANGLMYSYPKLSEDDAVGYFAKIGARIFFESIRECNGDSACVRNSLLTSKGFTSEGLLSGDIETRIIRDGRFEAYAQ